MGQRTCGEPGCTKPIRARGLCSTHYNQQHQPNRHTGYLIACLACGVEHRSARQHGRFCSLTCRDDWRARQATERRLPVGPVPRTYCTLPPRHPARRRIPAPRAWVAGTCTECGSPFIDNQLTARFCSPECAKRMHRRAWKERTDRAVPADVRAYVYERDGWTCWLCNEPIRRDVQAPHPLSHSVDHLVPQSRGGRHEAANLRAAHLLCNALRSDRCVTRMVLLPRQSRMVTVEV